MWLLRQQHRASEIAVYFIMLCSPITIYSLSTMSWHGHEAWAWAWGMGHGPMPELLTRASCRKDWKRISAESSLKSPRRPSQSRDRSELNWTAMSILTWTIMSRFSSGTWLLKRRTLTSSYMTVRVRISLSRSCAECNIYIMIVCTSQQRWKSLQKCTQKYII